MITYLISDPTKGHTSTRQLSWRSFGAARLVFFVIFVMMISGINGLRISHDQQDNIQRIFTSTDAAFKFRVLCPYSFLSLSKKLITDNKALNDEQRQRLLKDTYLTTLRVRDGHVKYNYNSTYLIEVRSIATAGPNDTINNHLYYCGLARNFYGTCQKDVKFSCTSPGSMFDVWTYQHIDVAFVNLLNPLVVPNPWEYSEYMNETMPLCFDPTLDDQVCSIYEKTNPLQTFGDPVQMHMKVNDHNQTEEDDQNPAYIKIRLNPNNWPISTHIHGLQVRPTMDGHPQSWVSNVGQRGTGAFSAQDQCYYKSFDNKETYTQKLKANGSPPPVMIITDSKGYDVTSVAKINRYPNAQSPGNLWYHDHAMRLTNYNAISGLVGYYYLRNLDVEKEIDVPRENEIFMLISTAKTWKDKSDSQFRGGQVYRMRFLNDLPDSEYNISFTHGGDCQNNASSSKIKFTMIGTDASMFDKGIENLTSFTISSGERLELLILLNQNFTNFDLCAQEKQGHSGDYLPLEVNKNDEFKLELKHPQEFKKTLEQPAPEPVASLSSLPMAPARNASNPYVGRRQINNVTLSVPYTDLSKTPENKVVVKKMRTLLGLYGSHNLFTLNGRSDFHQGWAEEPEIGTTEDYYFINLTPIPHPIHIHLVMFQVLREYELRSFAPAEGGDSFGNCTFYELDTLVVTFKSLLKTQTSINRILLFHLGRVFRNKMTVINYEYICYNRKYFYQHQTVRKHLNLIYPENAAPTPKTKVQGLDLLARATATDVINIKGSLTLKAGELKYVTNEGSTKIIPEHSKWKDTVFLKALRVYQFRVRWTKNDYEQGLKPKDTYFSVPLDQLREYPGFVYHCHIIHHEDYEMMRPIMLRLPKNIPQNQCIGKKTPCNYNETTKSFNVRWVDKYQCINDRCNAQALKTPSTL